MTVNVKLEPGDLVISRCGRDEGALAIVIGFEGERYVLVSDGEKRRFARPKRKNMLHLKPMGMHSTEVANSIRESGRVTNAKLRYAIVKFKQMLNNSLAEKGE